ncbi:hypothetical protein FKM82_009310 [Ascaphus truei]
MLTGPCRGEAVAVATHRLRVISRVVATLRAANTSSRLQVKNHSMRRDIAGKVRYFNCASIVSDYKRTSLALYVKVFEQFLDKLDQSRKGELLSRSDVKKDF